MKIGSGETILISLFLETHAKNRWVFRRSRNVRGILEIKINSKNKGFHQSLKIVLVLEIKSALFIWMILDIFFYTVHSGVQFSLGPDKLS